jgi:DEAD/DEAH box helicase domain-containing protein
MRYPLVLDLETKYSFRNFSDPKKLGISLVGVYDYKNGDLKAFWEKELNKLFPLLENASFIIGFNINNFDLPVLQAYYPGNIFQFRTLDILEDIKKILGRRLALNDIIKATLGRKKSASGLQAINYYQEGQLEELKRYCLDDVLLTKELFDYGVKNDQIFYLDVSGKVPIKVDWKKYLNNQEERQDVSLTLPF